MPNGCSIFLRSGVFDKYCIGWSRCEIPHTKLNHRAKVLRAYSTADLAMGLGRYDDNREFKS